MNSQRFAGEILRSLGSGSSPPEGLSEALFASDTPLLSSLSLTSPKKNFSSGEVRSLKKRSTANWSEFFLSLTTYWNECANENNRGVYSFHRTCSKCFSGDLGRSYAHALGSPPG